MTRHRKKTAVGLREGSRTHAVRAHLLAVAALVVSIAAAYSNSLEATWALDDVIAHKPVAMLDILDLVGFRKVAAVTFVLNQHIMPFSPVSFRVFNIFIHILATLCVYLLALRTFRLHSSAHIPADRSAGAMREDGPSGQRSLYAALLSGLVFGLHPLNTNAVTYVVQRMTSLAALFVLISLLCYIAGTLGKPLALALTFVPELCTYREMPVDVDLSGGISMGKTIGDFYNYEKRPANMKVALGVKPREFIDLFVERIMSLAQTL